MVKWCTEVSLVVVIAIMIVLLSAKVASPTHPTAGIPLETAEKLNLLPPVSESESAEFVACQGQCSVPSGEDIRNVCANDALWRDSEGNGCFDYERSAIYYRFSKNQLKSYANASSVDASDACCIYGGGYTSGQENKLVISDDRNNPQVLVPVSPDDRGVQDFVFY